MQVREGLVSIINLTYMKSALPKFRDTKIKCHARLINIYNF